MTGARLAVLLAALAVVRPAPASAEWQVKPFASLTFGGATNLLDSDNAIGERNPGLGVNVGWLGEIVGLEGDLGYVPGFLDRGDVDLVLKGRVITSTGNVVIAMPRHLTQYTLRPYFVAGGGLARTSIAGTLSVLEFSETFGVVDIGGGVTGFLSRRFGVNWEVRRFNVVKGSVGPGLTLDGKTPRLSFWRANMALAIRY